jgi:hypothetical protein
MSSGTPSTVTEGSMAAGKDKNRVRNLWKTSPFGKKQKS